MKVPCWSFVAAFTSYASNGRDSGGRK